MEMGWTDVGSGGYILVSCAHSNTSYILVLVSPSKMTTIIVKREMLYIQAHPEWALI